MPADEQAARADAGRTARLRLDLRDAAGAFSVEWYRAEDGQAQSGDAIPGGDWRELTAPWVGADVVLRLLRR